MNWYGIFFIVFFHQCFFMNRCYAAGPAGELSPLSLLLTIFLFFHLFIFFLGSLILFVKYKIRSARHWRYMLALLFEYFLVIAAMFLVNFPVAIFLLAFWCIGAKNLWMNQTKLYIVDMKHSNTDKLLLVIILLPVTIIISMFLIK